MIVNQKRMILYYVIIVHLLIVNKIAEKNVNQIIEPLSRQISFQTVSIFHKLSDVIITLFYFCFKIY